MKLRRTFLLIGIVSVSAVACTEYRKDLDYDYAVEQTWKIDGLHFGELIQFRAVHWDVDEALVLRQMIVDDRIAAGRRILDLNTGTGLIAILCQQNDAASVVATDRSEVAVANARYNAANLSAEDNLEVRAASPQSVDAFSGVAADEQFDLIVSHRRREPLEPKHLNSILDGLTEHLSVSGRCLIVCTRRSAVELLLERQTSTEFEVRLLGDRKLDTLPVDVVPGVIVEIRRTSREADRQGG